MKLDDVVRHRDYLSSYRYQLIWETPFIFIGKTKDSKNHIVINKTNDDWVLDTPAVTDIYKTTRSLFHPPIPVDVLLTVIFVDHPEETVIVAWTSDNIPIDQTPNVNIGTLTYKFIYNNTKCVYDSKKDQ